MDISNMKNIIVLKELPSNMVEEAIVILKSNIDLKKYKLADKKKENIKVGAKSKTKSKDYIIKEAEAVVTNYISNIEKPKQFEIKNKKLEEKYRRLKGLSIFLAIIASFGIIVNFI